jgi:hypothetical protein
MSEELKKVEERIHCKGECHRETGDGTHRCEAYGHHEWCQNYWVDTNLGAPEYFEEMQEA